MANEPITPSGPASKPGFNPSAPEGQAELDLLNSDDKPDIKPFETDKESDEDSDDASDGDIDDLTETSDSPDEEDSDSEGDESDAEDDADIDEVGDVSLYQAIKKGNPELFKKYPELKSVIFREQKLSAIFPSIDEAEQAKGKVESFTKLESDILEGKSDDLLEAIGTTDKDALVRFAHGLLPALLTQNKELYSEVIALPIKRAVQQAYIQAKKSGNTNLMNSALYLDDFFFEGDGISNDPKLSTAVKETKKTPEVERLERERDEHAERIRGEFNGSIIDSLKFRLGKKITESIAQFEFDDYKRQNVSRDIETEVNNLLAADTRYQAGIRSLYKQAQSAKYTSDWKARIISAYLARAIAVLPIAKKKVIEAATGRRQIGKEKKRLVPTNLSTQFNRTLKASDIDRSKTSDRDFLDDKITFKK